MLFRNVLQKFAKVIRKYLWWNSSWNVAGWNFTWKGLHPVKGFIPLKLGNFSEQFLPRTTFGECFCFGSCPCGALSKKYLVHQTNKHPLQVLRAILWGSFPPRKTWSTPRKNVPDGQVKVSTFFLNIFNFFCAAILQTSCKKLFLIFRCFPGL